MKAAVQSAQCCRLLSGFGDFTILLAHLRLGETMRSRLLAAACFLWHAMAAGV